MRVISGSAGGQHLKAPPGLVTRPMTDRVKESLFGTLAAIGYPQPGDRVLDLYAGSGALGIEALSRGAILCDFIEQSQAVAAFVKGNLASTGFALRGYVYQIPVASFLRTGSQQEIGSHSTARYDIIFMDPPYADPAILEVLERLAGPGFLADEGILVVGHAAGVELPEEPGTLRRLRHKTLGGSAYSVYKRARPG